MRKLVLMAAIAVMFSFVIFTGTAMAVPASPNSVVLTQPDGTTIDALQWGDEYSHGWQTATRYSIVKDNATNTWYYAVQDANGYLVKSDTPANLKAPKGLAPELRLGKKAAKEIAKNKKDTGITKIAPSTGTLKIPILLIDFPDYSYTKTKTQVNSSIFGSAATGPGDLQDYFKEVSNNQLTVTPGTGISDWVTASRTRSSYGGNDGNGDDVDAPGLVVEAIQKADASVDFSQYAVNGAVPVVIVIHAGYDESNGNFGSTDDIWAHNWDLTSAGYGALTVDGVTINNYTIQSELTCNAAFTQGGYMQAIGVIAHELGHAIGLPDTYDTSYATDGVGQWDLMASGSWNSINVAGDCPPHPSPIMKTYLGWQSSQAMTEGNSYTVGNIENNPGEIYMAGSNPGGIDWQWKVRSGTGEYWLLENRTQTKFNTALPGSGLLIWHVDEAASPVNNETNSRNPKFLGVEQADGLDNLGVRNDNNNGDAGDPWPGTTGKTAFTDTSNPSSTYHTGAASGVKVQSISQSGNNITFTYGTGGGTNVAVTGIDVSPAYASLNAGMGTQLTSTIYPANATNQNVTWTSSNNSVATVSSSGYVTGISSGSATITATTADGGYSDYCYVTVTGGGGTTYDIRGDWDLTYTWYGNTPDTTGLTFSGSASSGTFTETSGGYGPYTVNGSNVEFDFSNGYAQYNGSFSGADYMSGTIYDTHYGSTGTWYAERSGGGDTGDPEITVTRKDTGAVISEGASITMAAKAKLSVTVTVTDEYGDVVSKPKLKYTTSNSKVASMSKGVVKAGSTSGTATITITDSVTGATTYFYVTVSGTSTNVAGTWSYTEKYSKHTYNFYITLNSDGTADIDPDYADYGTYTVNGKNITIYQYGQFTSGDDFVETCTGTIKNSNSMSGKLQFDSGTKGTWKAVRITSLLPTASSSGQPLPDLIQTGDEKEYLRTTEE